MNNDTIIFAAALNALLIKRYEQMTSFFDKGVIQGCIDDARKIAALAQTETEQVAEIVENKKPRGRPKLKV